MRLAVAALPLILGACQSAEPPPAPPTPAPPSVAIAPTEVAAWSVRWTDGTVSSGLGAFRQVNGDPAKSLITDSVGAGCALFDFDRDGDLDAYLTNGIALGGTAGGSPPSDALFENDGTGRFTDVTVRAGLVDLAATSGVTVADVDGDAWPDLLLTAHGPLRLMRNRGDGTFEDVTGPSGLVGPSWSTGAAFFDADGDGDLDLYVAGYVDFEPGYTPEDRSACDYRGTMVFYGPRGLKASADRLFRNAGGMRFEDITARAGIVDPHGYGFQVVPFDADDDGDTDIFVANDSTENYLWRNRGDGTFEDAGAISGLALSGMGKAQASMGTALGDFGGDGRLDLVITHFSDDYTTGYRNEGRGFFTDVTHALRLAEPTNRFLSWGCHLFDADADSDLDLFSANGHVHPTVDRLAGGGGYRQRNQVFENQGGKFFERTSEAGDGFLPVESSRGSAVGDVDGDGDLDILVSHLDASPTLLLAEGVDTRRVLRIVLSGSAPNTGAIGAIVRLESGGRVQVRQASSSDSFLGSSEPVLHFGLGEAYVADANVTWPDGHVSRHEGLPGGHVVTIDERGGVALRPMP